MGQARRRREAQRAAMPPPGLQGDHSGTCIVCFSPTDTGLAFRGEAEWILAGLLNLGIPEDRVHPTLAKMDPAGWGRGMAPVGTVTVNVRVCAECAGKARDGKGLVVALMLPDHPIPGYIQPGHQHDTA